MAEAPHPQVPQIRYIGLMSYRRIDTPRCYSYFYKYYAETDLLPDTCLPFHHYWSVARVHLGAHLHLPPDECPSSAEPLITFTLPANRHNAQFKIQWTT